MPSGRLPTSSPPLSVGFVHADAVPFAAPARCPYQTQGYCLGLKSAFSQGVHSLFPLMIWRHRSSDWRLRLQVCGSRLVRHTTVRGRGVLVLSLFSLPLL